MEKSAVAAFAFLSVIPEGNLLLPFLSSFVSMPVKEKQVRTQKPRLATTPNLSSRPERSEVEKSAVAAFAFLSVIPEGNLLLPFYPETEMPERTEADSLRE